MPRTTPPILAAALAVGLWAGSESSADDALVLVVRAGEFDRQDTPVRVDLPGDQLGAAFVASLGDGSRALILKDLRDDRAVTAQAEPVPGGPKTRVRLTWVLAGVTPARSERRFRLEPGEPAKPSSPWSLSDPSAGAIDLKHGDRAVFRYNSVPVAHPDYGPIQVRDAYIHPAYTPSGALITGDYSKHHTHHRGFFLAYTKTQVGAHHPDFWNIQSGTGKIHFDGLDRAAAGPVTARLTTRHRWEAKGVGVVLRETWDIEVYDIPGSPYWLFDLTASQRAVGEPVELLPYRYGGMAYRGPEPFVLGKLDVLTSAGLDRFKGNEKPAKWVDLTGPVAEGSDRFGGAMICDHPTNPHFPTVARIHPILLPFFSFVPGHDTKVTIGKDDPTVFRYRILIHDGHPDKALDERVWRDFAEPPAVVLESESG